MIEAYKNYWANYANFKDRTSVGGYWWVVLMNLIISFVLGFIIGALGIETVELAEDASNLSEYFTSPGVLIPLLWSLVNLIPGLAIFTRRMHDTNRSGLLYLLLFIPLVNIVAAIVLIVFLCSSSVNEGNKYGDTQV